METYCSYFFFLLLSQQTVEVCFSLWKKLSFLQHWWQLVALQEGTKCKIITPNKRGAIGMCVDSPVTIKFVWMLMQPSYICKYETIWDYPTEACFAHLVSLGSLKVFQQAQAVGVPGRNEQVTMMTQACGKWSSKGRRNRSPGATSSAFEKPNWMKVGECCSTRAHQERMRCFWSNFVVVSPDFSFQV